MAKITVDEIRKLREETGAGIMDVKRALEDVDGDYEKASKFLMAKGFEKADKKSERSTAQGQVASYIHHSGKSAAILELLCETDFVARNDVFKTLSHEILLQIVSMNPKSAKELLEQGYVRDPQKKISDLLKEAIAKTGENIKIGRFYLIELGKDA